MAFHEEIKGKIVTVDRLDDMMIQEKNDKIQELEEENELLMQKIHELEDTIDDMKVSLPLTRVKDVAFAYQIQLLAPNSDHYVDFVTVHKNIWSDSETTKYLTKEIYNIVQEGLR